VGKKEGQKSVTQQTTTNPKEPTINSNHTTRNAVKGTIAQLRRMTRIKQRDQGRKVEIRTGQTKGQGTKKGQEASTTNTNQVMLKEIQMHTQGEWSEED